MIGILRRRQLQQTLLESSMIRMRARLSSIFASSLLCFFLLVANYGLVSAGGNYQLQFWSDQNTFTLSQNGTTFRTAVFHPALFGENFVAPAGKTNVTYQVVLAYPYMDGCHPLNKTSTGESYAGKIIVATWGCSFQNVALNAQSVGAVGVISVTCTNSICQTFQRTNPGPSVPAPALNIPFLSINHDDGLAIYNALNATVDASTWSPTAVYGIPSAPVYMTIVATNSINPNDWAALKAIASRNSATLTSPHATTGSAGRDWTDLLPASPNFNLDPCLPPRLFSVWCTGGRVTVLDMGGVDFGIRQVDDFAGLTAVSYVGLPGSQITGTIPCTFSALTNLTVWITPDGSITSVCSTFFTLSSLRYVDLSNNKISSFPAFDAINKVQVLDLHGNGASGVLPDLTKFQNLMFLDVSQNALSGAMPSLSGLSGLRTLSLASNSLSGAVPSNAFDGLTSITSIDISNNQLSGSVPNCVGVPALTYMDFSKNRFTGSIPASWASLTAIQKVLLSNNQLSGGLGNFLNLNALTTLDISYNIFTNGNYSNGDQDPAQFLNFALSFSIINANLANNRFNGPLLSTWLSLPACQSLDLHSNQITSISSDFFANGWANIQRFDISNNSLGASSALPLSLPPTMTSLSYNLNPNFVSPKSALLPVWATPGTSYVKNKITDTYQCAQIVGSQKPGFSLQIDPQYYGYTFCQCDRGTYNNPPSCYNIPDTIMVPVASDSSPNTSVVLPSYTDATFGAQRLSIGMNSVWQIGSAISTSDLTLRTITVNLIFNTSFFSKNTDVLDVYEGDASLLGARVNSFRGDLVSQSGITSFSVFVLNSQASINFKSRDVYGQHFTFTTTSSTSCPSGYIVYAGTNTCQQLFVLDTSLQNAVFALAAVFSAIILVIFVVFVIFRETVIVRSASPLFCYVILTALIGMSATSVLYALSPQIGAAICPLRPWMTGITSISTLTCLLTKANRIRQIFNSRVFKKKKSVSNSSVMIISIIIIGGEVLLLIILSGLSLTSTQIGPSQLIKGVEYSCTATDTTGFSNWLIIQFIYVLCFLVAGLYIAFSIKDTPSAFNESGHILNCIVAITFFLVILVPVNFIVNNNPNALMLIRGLGQSIAAITMTLAIFGPKLYYIAIGMGNSRELADTVGNGTKLSPKSDMEPVQVKKPLSSHMSHENVDKNATGRLFHAPSGVAPSKVSAKVVDIAASRGDAYRTRPGDVESMKNKGSVVDGE